MRKNVLLFLHQNRVAFALTGVLVLSAVNVCVTRIVVSRLDEAERVRVRALAEILARDLATRAAVDSTAAATRDEIHQVVLENRQAIFANKLALLTAIARSDSLMVQGLARLRLAELN